VASLKDIRKRIVSVRNTQQVTKAMKMVSAAKLRRAQAAAESARSYSDKLTELLRGLASAE
jgi:F-type H+-transporting ATPase subunit gamma